MLYQTPEDLARERVVAEAVARWLRLSPRKLPDTHVLDFALLDQFGQIERWLEVKCRPGISYNYGDGFYLSLDKVIGGRRYEATGIGAELAVQTKDGRIWLCGLCDHEPGAFIWGRRDRTNDDKAIEPSVCYRWRKFTEVPHEAT